MSASDFRARTDASTYVPYAGAERVLEQLEDWACGGERPVRVLLGPEGAGKSMLLAVLAARVGRHALPVSLVAPGLDPETLAREILTALGTSWEGTPRVALARAIEEPASRRVLLLIDDADALAPRTEMWLFDIVRRSGGALLALLAVRDERLADELASAFQVGTPVLTLDTPMTREETEAWVRAELARSGADPGRFQAGTIARLHEHAGGLPGRLREQVAALLVAPKPVPAPAPAVSTPAPTATPASGREARAGSATPAGERPRAAEPSKAAWAVPLPAAETGAREPGERPPAPARPAARNGAPPSSAPTRPSVGPAPSAAPSPAPVVAPPPPAAPQRRDSLLRWLFVPGALAAAYVAGFLTSQTLEVLRPSAAPPVVRDAEPSLPPVSSAPPPAVEAAPPAATGAPAPAPLANTAPPPGAAPLAAEQEAEPSAPAPAVADVAPVAPPAVAAEAAAESAAPAADAEKDPFAALGPPTETSGPEAEPEDEPAARAALEPPAPAPAAEAAPEPARQPAPARTARRTPARPRLVDVTVEAEPGASIYVNGEPVGSGTVSGIDLPPGPHRVEVRLPDGRVVDRVVEVKGTRYEVKVR